MIKFSVDYYNKKTFFKSLDYSNKVILNAVADPLFIYNKKEGKYKPNACQEYDNNNNKKYTITIRDDLYFSDGDKVLARDYVKAIINAKENLYSEYFCNIDNITYTDYTIEIVLKKKDNEFINKLSIYMITPKKGNIYSGRFQFNISDKTLIFSPNKYYRFKAFEKLSFLKINKLEDNIKMFKDNKLDITNNTLLQLSNGNINNEYSNIIYSIELSTKIPKKERKKIIKSIDKRVLIEDMGDGYFVKDDFFCSSKSKYKTKNIPKNNVTKEFSLCYSNYYPNPQVATKLKKILKQNNYKIKLIECDYETLKDYKKNDTDMKLVLNYFEFNSDYYFYENRYFQFIMKKNKLYNWCLKYKKMKRLMNKCFKNQYIKEPLISFYSNFLTNEKTSNYSYLECDYNKIVDK